MKFGNFTPYFLSILIFASFEIFYAWPDLVVYGLFLLLILTAIALYFYFDGLKNWNFIVFPLLYLLSAVLFALFINNMLIKHLLAVFLAVTFKILVENIKLFLAGSSRYQMNSLENLVGYLSFLAVYMFTTALYGLLIFLNLPIYLVAFAELIIIVLILNQVFWSNKIDSVSAFPYIVVISLLMFEAFWLTYFLPLAPLVSGMIIALGYYFLTGLALANCQGEYKFNYIKKYLIITLAGLTLIIVSFAW